MLGCNKVLLLCLLIPVIALVSNASAQDDDEFECVPYPRCLYTQTRDVLVVIRPNKNKTPRGRPTGRPRTVSTKPKRQFDLRDERFNPYRIRNRCNCRCGWMNSKAGYPWMLRIAKLNKNSNSGDRLETICSGTLLNREFVLTAAHCVSNEARPPRNLFVVLGDDGKNTNSQASTVVIQVVAVIPHSSFDSVSLENDVALLKLLPSNVEYDESIAPVCLPPKGSKSDGKKGVALAWGWKDLANGEDVDSVANRLPYDLIKEDVSIRSGKRCRDESSNFTYTSITNNMLCVDPTQQYPSGPICKGDSGGPLLVRNRHMRYEIRGVAARFVGCGDFAYPTIYADVNKYISWIAESTGSHCITCQ